MEQKNLSGQLVALRSSTGIIRRIVVADHGDILLVSRQEEYEDARRVPREPVTIGFKRGDLVDFPA